MSTAGKDFETAKLGYEMATQLWIYEGNSIWSKFNTMLVAHSIAIAAVAQLNTPIVWLIAAVLGVLVCLIWRSWMKRGFETIDCWINTAKEIEQNYFSPTISNVQKGGDFAEGKSILFDFNGNPKTLKMSKLGQRWSVRDSANKIIYLFMIVYVIIIFFNLYKIICCCCCNPSHFCCSCCNSSH